jgi:hypothetical protein
MEERGFELRAGAPILDALDHASKIENARGAIALGKQTPQTPAQQSRAREIRAAFAGPQQEYGRAIGRGLKLGWIHRHGRPHDPILAVV